MKSNEIIYEKANRIGDRIWTAIASSSQFMWEVLEKPFI